MRNLLPNPAFGPVRADLDRLFGRIFEEGTFAVGGAAGAVKLDVAELTDSYQVRAELPGLSAEAIELKLDGRTLTIRGEKPRAFEDEAEQVIHRETGFGAFRRQLQFPLPVDGEGVEAQHENGVLTISVPKAQTARARTIEVRSGRVAPEHNAGEI